ncbi:unnamed protein product [Tilletia controversa]|nr:unnamed protein product [Tilletia controversa]
MFVLGAWSAARCGHDVGLLDEAERQAMREARQHGMAWEDYGAEGDIQANSNSQQPHVQVDKISERVPPVLNDAATHQYLRQLLPDPPFPPPSDFGLSVYVSVLEAIDEIL